MFVDEINLLNPALFGTLSNTVRIDSTEPGARKCGLDNYYWRDAYGAARSADGRYLTLLCLDVPYGDPWPDNAITTYKTVVRVSADMYADTTTAAVNLIQGACGRGRVAL